MNEFLVQLRDERGISQSVSVDPKAKLTELKKTVGNTIGVQTGAFQLYSKGQLLDCDSMESTIENIGLEPNSVIDVSQKPVSSNAITLIFQYGMGRVALEASKQETVRSVKSRISDIINCESSSIDLICKDDFLELDNKTLSHYSLQNQDVVSVKRKLPITGLISSLGTKLKVVESVASSSDHVDENERDYSPMLKKKGFNVQKKSSCSASLRNIKDPDQKGIQQLKHSSIEPYTMHKNQIDQVQEKQNKLLNIEDIKETMSFGSLEESKTDETEAEVRSEDGRLYVRFCCPLGCRVSDLKRKLATVNRVGVESVEILQAEDPAMVEDLSVMGDRINLTFRIINKQ